MNGRRGNPRLALLALSLLAVPSLILLSLLNQGSQIASGAPGSSGVRHADVINNWTDAFNSLDLIAGPQFLLLFVLYAVCVTLVMILMRNRLQGLAEPGATFISHDRLPIHLKPTFLEIAYLRGGKRAMLEMTICNLYRMGVLSRYLSQVPAGVTIRAGSSPTPLTKLNPLEMAICDSLENGTMPYNLASDRLIQPYLAQAAATAKTKLRMLGLLPSSGTWFMVGLSIAVALLLVDGVAAIRLIRSSLRGYHNVALLQILTVVVTIGIPIPLLWMRQSRAGKQFLTRLRADAKAILRKTQAMTGPQRGPEILYAVAAIGAGAFGGTAYEEIHNQLIPPAPQSSSSSDSCSSCSGGSCGGGGCGGGGCGGGGCGGG